jgi:hypothetical protein
MAVGMRTVMLWLMRGAAEGMRDRVNLDALTFDLFDLEGSVSRGFSSLLGRPCALYPAMERFGTPVKFANYTTVKCLGRGEQGEAWLTVGDDAVLKVFYKGDADALNTSLKACKFSKAVADRDPEHFVRCWKTGAVTLDMKTDDEALKDTSTYTPIHDCDVCPGSKLKGDASMILGPELGNYKGQCMDAQLWAAAHSSTQEACQSMVDVVATTSCCATEGEAYDFAFIRDSIVKPVTVVFSVDERAHGSEVLDFFQAGPHASDMYPTLRDAFKMLLEVYEIAGNLLTSTSDYPAQFYYLDLHLGNVMVSSDKKLTFIDYGSTYMCCDTQRFQDAAANCGDLPECSAEEQDAYLRLTVNFLFMDIVAVLTGEFSKFAVRADSVPGWDGMRSYFKLRTGLFPILQGGENEDQAPAITVYEREILPHIKGAYLTEWKSLGDLATELIVEGLEQIRTGAFAWPPRAYKSLKLAVQTLELPDVQTPYVPEETVSAKTAAATFINERIEDHKPQ